MKHVIFLLSVFYLTCCKNDDKYILVKGAGIKNEWVPFVRMYNKNKLIYEYYYNDSTYTDSLVMGAGDIFYKEGDSLLVRIKKDVPHKPEITGSFYRKNTGKTVHGTVAKSENTTIKSPGNEAVAIENSGNDSLGKSYHRLDCKPLFNGALNPEENDSTVCDYIKKKTRKDNRPYIKGTALSITINESGKVERVSKIHRSEPYDKSEEDYYAYLKQVLYDMPEWKPGVKDNKTVKVAYLVVLK